VIDQSSCPLSTGKLGEYLLYYLFYPAYIFDLLKLIGEKLKTANNIVRVSSSLSNNNNICNNYSSSNNSSSSSSSNNNNKQSTIDTNIMGRKKQVQQSACDDDFSIRIDWRYDRPITKKLIQIDLKDIRSIRKAFPELNRSILSTDIPNSVLGFSANFKEVCKAMEEFCMLDREQQQLFHSFYRQHVPQSLKDYHRSNINLLQDQSRLLREKEEHILSQPTNKVGRPVKRKKVLLLILQVPVILLVLLLIIIMLFVLPLVPILLACSATDTNKDTCTDTNINTGTNDTSIRTMPSPAAKKLPSCFCFATDCGTKLFQTQMIDKSFLQQLLHCRGGVGSSSKRIAIQWTSSWKTNRYLCYIYRKIL